MARDMLYYENRIALLESRKTKDNKRIVAKLKREMKKLAATGSPDPQGK